MTGERKWCDICGEYIYPDDEPESECCYLDCPMSPIPVRDHPGDERTTAHQSCKGD